MKYPELLHPTDTQIIRLSSQTSLAVPKCTPQFTRWQGAPIEDTYNGKALLDFHGRPAFAELVILWSFMTVGWNGVWIDTYRQCYRQGYWDAAPCTTLPQPARDLLAAIHVRAGSQFGAWDVFCWRDEAILFAESKRQSREHIRHTQIHWLGAALACGIPQEAFLVVEWSTG